VDVADLENAGKRPEEYAKRRKQERAAPLKRVKWMTSTGLRNPRETLKIKRRTTTVRLEQF